MNKNENRGILHQVIDAMKKDLKEDGSSKYPEMFLEGIIMDLLLGGSFSLSFFFQNMTIREDT